MHCVFIHGPVACGKLTIAKRLQDLSGWPLHHNHLAVDAAMSLFPFGTQGFRALRAAIWRAAFQTAAMVGQSFIFTFAPESTVPRSLVDALVYLAQAQGGRVFFVELSCAEDEIERRVVAADRGQHLKLNSLEEYRSLRDAGAFRTEPMPSPTLRIRTDMHAAETCAEHIFAELRLRLEG